jgi:molybdenum cofactor synthesis domain-containing protein
MAVADLLSLDEARARILRDVLPLLPQTVPLAEALGRVLAEDAAAMLTLPPWDNSAMDGFAVKSEDVASATPAAPVSLAVIGEVAAGHEPGVRVVPGTAVRILTGAIVPAGADAVVPIEDTDATAGVAERPDHVVVRAPAAPGAHVRRAGDDIVRGQPIVAAGTRLGPATLAALAATGHDQVAVHRRPCVAVLATGDELVAVGEPLGPASIPDSNSESIAAQVLAAGGEPVRLGIAIDDTEAVRERMLEGVLSADVLVATGGVSVGARDVVKEVFEAIGTLDLWRVAVQPGKPLAYGSAPRPDGGYCVLFGLPGNPVSSFVTFELFVRPVLRRLQGADPFAGRLRVRAVLVDAVRTDPLRRAFVRVRLGEAPDAQGRYRAALAGGQGSHIISALAAADGLAIVPEGVAELDPGTEVEVIRLDVEVS